MKCVGKFDIYRIEPVDSKLVEERLAFIEIEFSHWRTVSDKVYKILEERYPDLTWELREQDSCVVPFYYVGKDMKGDIVIEIEIR